MCLSFISRLKSTSATSRKLSCRMKFQTLEVLFIHCCCLMYAFCYIIGIVGLCSLQRWIFRRLTCRMKEPCTSMHNYISTYIYIYIYIYIHIYIYVYAQLFCKCCWMARWRARKKTRHPHEKIVDSALQARYRTPSRNIYQ